jgi:hypothetical protein
MPIEVIRRPVLETSAAEILNDTVFNVNWTNQGGAGEAWTLGATDLSVTCDEAISERVRRTLSFTSGEMYSINLLFTLSGPAGIKVKVYLGGTQLVDFGTFTTGSPFDETLTILATSDYTYFEIEADTTFQSADPVVITISDVIIDEGVDASFQYNSIALPTIYELERRDFTWNQVNDNGGDVQIQFTGVDVTASFSIGDSVYVYALAGSPYDGFTTVTAVSFSAGNTLVTVDITYVSTSTSGFINNDTERPGYYVEVRFYDIDNVQLTEAIQEVSPNSVGTMIVDISEFSKAFLSPDFEIGTRDLALFNITNDDLASKEIYISTKEVWIGSQELEVADSSNPITVVLGAQQLPLDNGSNYGTSVDRYTSDISGTLQAKFLRRSTNPICWRGWPFSLSFLLTVDAEYDLSAPIRGDINTLGTGSGADPLEGNLMRYVNIGGAWASFPTDTRLMVHIINDGTSDQLTEEITLLVKEPCQNPVLLLFRNSLGGDCWHMFDYSQEYSYTDDNGTKVKRMLLNTNSLTADQWDELNDLITYGADLKENIVEILPTTNKTKTRAYQQVYKVDQDGTLTGVIVIPTINTTNTKRYKHTFEVEIEFPEYFLP